jgi:hypothetical protein
MPPGCFLPPHRWVKCNRDNAVHGRTALDESREERAVEHMAACYRFRLVPLSLTSTEAS